MAAVYDAGALIAADRGDRRFLSDHRERIAAGVDVVIPAAVVAQVSRSPRQATMNQVIRSAQVVPLDESAARVIGALLVDAGTADVVDGAVVVVARSLDAFIVTADHDDIATLCEAAEFETVLVEP